MPEKKPKEAPAIVDDVLQADGAKARLSAVRATAIQGGAPNDDAPDWLGTCAICLDALPLEGNKQTFYSCCCKSICTACYVKCRQYDARCPLCRTPATKSDAEWLRRLQKHVDKGNAKAQITLGDEYFHGRKRVQQNFKRAVQLYELAAAQGNARAQNNLGSCYTQGQGVEIDHKTSAQWYRRAAEQGHPVGQLNLGNAFYHGAGVAQSYDEAVKWLRLAAAQGYANALFSFAACHANGRGVPKDIDEALRLFKRAAAKGHAGAAAAVDKLTARLAAHSGRRA
jgi:hypothetical protein